MPTFSKRNPEKGSVLLETIVFVFILVTFTVGAARIHRSFARRFDAIVRARNQQVGALRAGLRGQAP